MANGYNPYTTSNVNLSLLDEIMRQQQTGKKLGTEIGIHKSKMRDELEAEVEAAQREQERILAKKRKKNFLESIIPGVASLFGGPLAGGIASGLTGMLAMGDEQKHAKKQIDLARDAGIDKTWEDTFLKSEARDISTQTDTVLDEMEDATKLSGLDYLTKGLIEGVIGYGAGKVGQNVKDAFGIGEFGKFEEFASADPEDFSTVEKFGWIPGEKTEGTFFEKLKKGLSVDPSTLFSGKGGDKDLLQNLLMLLQKGMK